MAPQTPACFQFAPSLAFYERTDGPHHGHQPLCLAAASAASAASAQNKRKEKARLAARARRSQEGSIILEMANELNISADRLRRTDKATIVKLAIEYIRAFEVLCKVNCCFVSLTCGPRTSNLSVSMTVSQVAMDADDATDDDQEDHQRQQRPIEAPKLITTLIFSPKTPENANSNYLMIEKDGALVLKPDEEIDDNDDLTHLAPLAGDLSIPLADLTDNFDGSLKKEPEMLDFTKETTPASSNHHSMFYSLVRV